MELVMAKNEGVLESFPKLHSLIERTKNLPNIKKWMEVRPVTES